MIVDVVPSAVPAVSNSHVLQETGSGRIQKSQGEQETNLFASVLADAESSTSSQEQTPANGGKNGHLLSAGQPSLVNAEGQHIGTGPFGQGGVSQEGVEDSERLIGMLSIIGVEGLLIVDNEAEATGISTAMPVAGDGLNEKSGNGASLLGMVNGLARELGKENGHVARILHHEDVFADKSPVSAEKANQTGLLEGRRPTDGVAVELDHMFASLQNGRLRMPSYVMLGGTVPLVQAVPLNHAAPSGVASESLLTGQTSTTSVNLDEKAQGGFGLGQQAQQEGEPSSAEGQSPVLASRPSEAQGNRPSFLQQMEGTIRQGAGSERSHMMTANPPQRLHMDVTLPDATRLQLEVAVQHRQVSANLLIDQLALRNLVLHNQSQLDTQLTTGGLELKDFKADVRDQRSFDQASLERENRGTELEHGLSSDREETSHRAPLMGESQFHYVA